MSGTPDFGGEMQSRLSGVGARSRDGLTIGMAEVGDNRAGRVRVGIVWGKSVCNTRVYRSTSFIQCSIGFRAMKIHNAVRMKLLTNVSGVKRGCQAYSVKSIFVFYDHS